jgi:hypothetical protein
MVICVDGNCFEIVIIDVWPPRMGSGPINDQDVFEITMRGESDDLCI